MSPVYREITLKTLAFKAFRLAAKPFIGSGIGRFRLIRIAYRQICRRLLAERPVEINGYKMFIGENFDYPELLFESTYEKYETALFRRFVSDGMNVLDLGANIGYYTLLAAKLVGETGTVFAFEPEPENFAILSKNVEINGYKNVILERKAVFSETRQISLFLGKFGCGQHSISGSVGSMGTIVVDAVRLDDFFEGKESLIDIIKMDIEGAEMGALLGMNKILRNNGTVKLFTEFCPELLKLGGGSPKEYWEKLLEFGFKFIYLIDEQKQRLVPANFNMVVNSCIHQRTPLKRIISVNLLCTKSALEG